MSNAKVNFDLPTGIENLDITVNFTSKIYPIITQESYTTTGGLRGFNMWEAVSESYDVDADVTTIALRPVLLATELLPESYDTTPDLLTIELDTVLKATVLLPESYDTTPDLTTITLESKLVSTTLLPESYDTLALVTSLELTS